MLILFYKFLLGYSCFYSVVLGSTVQLHVTYIFAIHHIYPPLFSDFLPLSRVSRALMCLHMCLVTPSCPTLCDPMDCSPPGSSVLGDSPDKNTGVGCHALLQGIFPTQVLNPCSLYCRRILYCLGHQGSPIVIYLIHSINSVYMSVSISQFTPSLPFPLVPMFFSYICVSISGL